MMPVTNGARPYRWLMLMIPAKATKRFFILHYIMRYSFPGSFRMQMENTVVQTNLFIKQQAPINTVPFRPGIHFERYTLCCVCYSRTGKKIWLNRYWIFTGKPATCQRSQ